MGRFLGCWRCFKVKDDGVEVKAWLRSFHAESEDDAQSRRSIAVAAAAAAAAEAAVAAAQAAAAAVRLTGKRSDNRKEKWAAITIQSAFRGHLAKKALRALRAIVKLQALVKGYLVRKHTAITISSMQALMRVQASMRLNRAPTFSYSDGRSQPLLCRRRSLEREHVPSLMSSPKTIRMDACSNPAYSSPLPKCRDLRDHGSSTTASSTPRLAMPASGCGSPHCPNYMASTRSFDAKMRSQSAPRRRGALLKEEVVGSRGRLSGVGKEAEVSLKSAVVGRMDRSLELLRRDEARDYHLKKRRSCDNQIGKHITKSEMFVEQSLIR